MYLNSPPAKVYLLLQLFVKAVTIVCYAKPIYELSREVLDVHNKEKGPYREIMYDWARRLNIITKVQLVLYSFSSIVFCLYPLYGYIVLNEKLLIYDLLLPFDPETKNGYAIIIAIQIFLTYGTGVIIFAVDSIFMLMVLSGASFFSLFECDCKMLSITIEKSDDNLHKMRRNNKSNTDEIYTSLIKCIQRSQYIYEFEKTKKIKINHFLNEFKF